MDYTGDKNMVHKASSPTVEDGPQTPLARLKGLWAAATKGTVISSIFILLTTCVGAGTLSLPHAFSQGGIFVFSIVFLLVMLMSVYVGSMLLSGKKYCTEVYPEMDVWSYEDLAYASFGLIGRIASLLTIAVLLFLGLIAYMIYTRDQLAAVVEFIVVHKLGWSHCHPLLNCGVLMCIGFIPIFPVTLLRKLTPLQFTSYLSILSIILVAVMIMVKTILVHSGHSANDMPLDHNVGLAPNGFRAVLTVISYCSLSFICHFNLLPLQKELTKPSKLKLYAIVVGSMLMAYLIYNVVIFSSYFNFYHCIKSDVMLNYASDDVIITVARGFLFVTILMHYPVLLHPTRANINGAVYLIYKAVRNCVYDDETAYNVQTETKPLVPTAENATGNLEFKVPRIPWFLETAAIFCATFIIATFISDVGLVWNFVGSTAGVLVLYIYPSAFYLRLRYVRYQKRAQRASTTILAQYNIFAVLKEALAWIIFGLGLVLLVVENYQAIYAVVEQGKNSTTIAGCQSSSNSSVGCYAVKCNSSADDTDYTTTLFST